MRLDAGERFVPKEIFGDPATHQRGKPQKAFASAPVRVHELYRTPTEHHNPLEPHGTVAQWSDGKLTLYDSTQWAFSVRRRMAAVFSIDEKDVRVIAPFVGGAFGSKGQAWSHVPLAAMAAKLVQRPVKLLATRPQMFAWIAHRPQTEQVVSLGADPSGQLQAALHEVRSETSLSDEYIEPCGVFSRDLYTVPHYAMSHELRRLTISKPTFQRGPGESTGSLAFESAMDELSYALQMDPIELRLRNYSENHPDSGKPYSSKHLRECYRLGAERFGWGQRDPRVRSMRNGGMLVGMGMATASRNCERSGASVRICMTRDGRVVVQCGTIEQGAGSPTVFTQLAAEILDIPFDRVTFEFGDTNLPDAPLAAGSQTAASVGSAVVIAAQHLRDRLAAANGNVPPEGIDLTVRAEPGDEEERYAIQAFGAQFAQVEVDPDLGIVRVTRFVGAFEAGRILNEKTARSQFLGGIVWGISMALFEKTRYDVRTGRIMNANLAEYLVPTNADIPNVEIAIVDGDDPHANEAHVKGIGEVGITGAAAAVANAVYHASGIRVRDMPITPEKLLV
jgi:xanthine dehydrogenase YagR molybdenum-binding subunit